MALKGYFIQATFEDGTEVSAYAAYDGTWYYFYTDRRFRFTLTSAGAVDIQQYQPIGSNMAWYDIDIITAVNVEQFDPDNSGGGGGTIPEDVYTKEEVQQLIAEAVAEVEAQIPDLVAQAVQVALDELDDRYVLKAGDTMTGTLRVQNAAGRYSVLSATECTVFGKENNVFMNPTTGFGVTTSSGQYKGRLDQDGYYRCNPPGDSTQRVVMNYTGVTFYYQNNYWAYLRRANEKAYFTVRSDNATNYSQWCSEDFVINRNGGNKIWIRTTDDEGDFIAYDGSGNNTWYTPVQISAWTNGGTSQSLITPGADVISFNKTVQVPSSASFLVSGQCRYGGSFINRYGNSYAVEFNDTTYGTLSALNTLTFSSNYDVAIYRNAGGGNVRGMLVTSSDILLQIAAGSTWVSDIINSSGATDFLQVRQITFKDSGGNSVGTIVGNPGSISMTSNNLQFTDGNNSTTLSYIMSNLGGGGSGGGDIANVTQINIVDSNGTLIGTISGSTGSGLQIASAGAYPVSIHTGSTYQSRLSLSGGNMTLSTGGQSGQYIWIKDAVTENKSSSLGTYCSAAMFNGEVAYIGNQTMTFCNNIITLLNNFILEGGLDLIEVPKQLSASGNNVFGLKVSNIQEGYRLGSQWLQYLG